jgi:NAD(P)-dependent dehydrogenase (short-subunit alcohol dehydrogenase family)
VPEQRGGLQALHPGQGSKAALNMFMRSFAAQPAEAGRALAVIAPGWIRTALGGPDAPFTVAETVRRVAGVLLATRGEPGLELLDRTGGTVPW